MAWVFAIFIGIAIISALSHFLKNQQQAAPPLRRRQSRPQKSESSRGSSDADQDRFLAEIERLRKKAASAPPTARAVPVVKPIVKAKKPRASQQSTFMPKLSDLPVASISPQSHGMRASETPSITVTPASNVADIAKIATIHGIVDVIKPMDAGGGTAAKMLGTSSTMSGISTTGFAKEMMGFFKSNRAIPMAVVLHEILGEPKCRQRK